MAAEWEKVRDAARGSRADYWLSSKAEVGGQGTVHSGKHRDTGCRIAFKKLNPTIGEDGKARMRREIELGTSVRHPNVIPVLDAAKDHSWLVMPWCIYTLASFRETDPDLGAELPIVVRSICEGLRAIHGRDQVHRDLKPANVLWLEETEEWVIADFGLIRNPLGQTSVDGRTQVGVSFGTMGFAAPELYVDAHSAGAPADFYSLGQIIGWWITGTPPDPSGPLLPPGPWHSVVRWLTKRDPQQRPQDVDEVLEVVDRFTSAPLDPPSVRAALVLEEEDDVKRRDAGIELFKLAADHDDYELYIDKLSKLGRGQVQRAVEDDPRRAEAVMRALPGVEEAGDFGYRNFDQMNDVIILTLDVARAAIEVGDFELLEEACAAMFLLDARWDRWRARNQMTDWLQGLRDEPAAVVAQALRGEPDAAAHFDGLSKDTRVDARIRAAISVHVS